MKKRFVLMSLSTAALVVAATRALGTTTAPPTPGETQTLNVRMVDISEHYVDVGEPGGSEGDSTTFAAHLVDVDHGTLLGTVQGQCTLLDLDQYQREQCLQTFTLSPGPYGSGDLAVHGVRPAFPSPRPITVRFAITGGTGDFAGASGETQTRFPTSDRVTLRFTTS